MVLQYQVLGFLFKKSHEPIYAIPTISLYNTQCSKLRVHSAPGAHISLKKSHKTIYAITNYILIQYSVFEIKGALSARRSHFHLRSHFFGRVHPMSALFFLLNSHCNILEECTGKFLGTQFQYVCTHGAHKIKP